MREINYTYSFKPDYKTDYSEIYQKQNSQIVGPYAEFNEYNTLRDDLIQLAKKRFLTNGDPMSRRVIVFNTTNRHSPNCLSSLQLLSNEDDKITNEYILIANFRSQHSELGRPHDAKYLSDVAQMLFEQTEIYVESVICNVADYHYYPVVDDEGYNPGLVDKLVEEKEYELSQEKIHDRLWNAIALLTKQQSKLENALNDIQDTLNKK